MKSSHEVVHFIALKLAPGSADVWSDRGATLRRLGRWEESIENFRKALVLDPANRSHKSYMVETLESIHDGILAATVSLKDARPDEMDIQLMRSMALFQKRGDTGPIKRALEAMNLEASTNDMFMSASVHMLERNPDAAIETLNNPIWLQMSAAGTVGHRERAFQLGEAWLLKGDEAQARIHYEIVADNVERALASVIQVQAYSATVAAMAMARLSRFDEALALAEKLTSEIPYQRDAMLWGLMMMRQGFIRGLSGDRAKAIEELRIGLATPTAMPITSRNLHMDPAWDFMRDEPEFVKLATPDNIIRAVD